MAPLCVSAQTLSRADGSTDARPWIEIEQGPFVQTLNGGIVLTHSVSEIPAESNSVVCRQSDTGFHTENSYYRRFNLPDFEVEGELTIDSVQIAVERAEAGTDGVQPIGLRFYMLTGEFVTSNLTDLGDEVTQFVEDTTLAPLTIPVVDVVVPADSELVVEVHVPDGRSDGYRFYIGSNAEGETAPGYILAEECDIDQPTPLAETDPPFPDMHLIMTVFGHAGAVVMEPGAGEPQQVVLGQSYPNPLAGDVATIPFELTTPSEVRIAVYDALGREIAVPADGTYPPGRHAVPLNVSSLSDGVYTYRLMVGGEVQARRMVVVH